jgi:hypothetical protein
VLRGWTDPHPKPVRVPLAELTDEFKKRMNHPEETPLSFNKEKLQKWAEEFKDMPRINEDWPPRKSFSRKLTLEDIEWGKRHIMNHMLTASGIDDFSYGDIIGIPNEKLLALLQAVIDKKIFPSKWLAALVAGILKARKDQLNRSYHLVVLECCLPKFLTLLIDRRIKEYANEAKLIPGLCLLIALTTTHFSFVSCPIGQQLRGRSCMLRWSISRMPFL